MQSSSEDDSNESNLKSVELHSLELLLYAEAICLGIHRKGYRLLKYVCEILPLKNNNYSETRLHVEETIRVCLLSKVSITYYF